MLAGHREGWVKVKHMQLYLQVCRVIVILNPRIIHKPLALGLLLEHLPFELRTFVASLRT